MTTASALVHPLAIVGALIATASAVVFIALADRELTGCSTIRTPASWSSSPSRPSSFWVCCSSRWACGCSGASCARHPKPKPTGRSSTSGEPSPPHGAALHRAHRRQRRHPPARRLRQPALDGIAAVLRPGVPHADAAAVHRLAGGAARAGRVRDCHIGEGAQGFVYAKLAGTRQLVHVMTGRSEADPAGRRDAARRPGPDVRAATDPGAIVGDRLRVIREYADDEATPRRDGAADARGRPRRRAARSTGTPIPPSAIEYVATDAERQTIPYVQGRPTHGPGQGISRGRRDRSGDRAAARAGRWTASIATTPSGIRSRRRPRRRSTARSPPEQVSRKLPFVRREGVRAGEGVVPSEERRGSAIDRGLRDFYATQGGADRAGARAAVAAPPGRVPPQRVSLHESDMGRLSGQQRPHRPRTAASAATTTRTRPRTARPSAAIASTATRKSRTRSI